MGFLYPHVSPQERLVESATNKLLNTAQKPVELMKWIVRHFSRPTEWVCDLCCGTGSFSVGALYEGRSVLALDVSPIMVQRTAARVNELCAEWDTLDFVIANPYCHVSDAHNHVMWNLLFAPGSIPAPDRPRFEGIVSADRARELGWSRFEDVKRRMEEDAFNPLLLSAVMALLKETGGEHGTRIATKADISNVAIRDKVSKEVEDYDSVADRIKLPGQFRET